MGSFRPSPNAKVTAAPRCGLNGAGRGTWYVVKYHDTNEVEEVISMIARTAVLNMARLCDGHWFAE